MNAYIYESIEIPQNRSFKTFITSIEHSGYHWHYEYELILVLKGGLLINTHLGESRLNAGDIILINSKTIHEITHTEQKNVCLLLQIFHGLFTDRLNSGRSYCFYLNSSSNSEIPKNGFTNYKVLMAQIYLESQKEKANRYRLSSYIYTLLADFFDNLIVDVIQQSEGSNPTKDYEITLLMKVMSYVQENCRLETVEKNILKEFGLSEKTLYRFLRKYLGLPLKTLITNNRINAAKEMLLNSTVSISYIAFSCGFGTDNTFHRNFKDKTGLTPLEYRKAMQDKKTREMDPKIQGYLAFDHAEAVRLVKKIIMEETTQ
jgi:AraC-like DNA-binding protein